MNIHRNYQPNLTTVFHVCSEIPQAILNNGFVSLQTIILVTIFDRRVSSRFKTVPGAGYLDIQRLYYLEA